VLFIESDAFDIQLTVHGNPHKHERNEAVFGLIK